MPARIVRCSNCGEVVEAEPGICSACGGPLRLLPAAPPETARSYAERYRGSEFDSAAPAPILQKDSISQDGAILMVGLGIALVLVVVVVGAMLLLGGGGGPKATLPPQVFGRTPTPTPLPTAGLVVQHAYTYLSDPAIRAEVTVHTDYALDKRVTGQPQTLKVDLTATFADGSSKGEMNGQSAYFFVCLKDKFWTKPSGGKWAGVASCRLNVLPLFGLTKQDQLKLVGQETVDGVYTYHLVTTDRWKCDPLRISLLETALPLTPTTPTLDLWVTGLGEPIKAEFTANFDAPDGTRLLALSSRYLFSEVGAPQEISAPV